MEKEFIILGWWMKGKINALSCLGYGVMHATLEGYSFEILGAIRTKVMCPITTLIWLLESQV
jgi:hypothetical protein